MKIAIIGAGGIGGYLGAMLALGGEEVTFMVRGANLQAIRERGIKLITSEGDEHVARNVEASNDYASAGVQDVVVVATKAHQVAAVADDLMRLVGPETAIVTMQNGIPFWYFHRHGGPLDGTPVRSVDPEGLLQRTIPAAQVIGSVVYPACELVAAGVVRHVESNRFALGELDGSRSERVQRIARCFEAAGLKAPVLEDIRCEIWLKLWGNLSFNPISALSHATLVDICRYPLSRALVMQMMTEAEAVAQKLDIRFRIAMEKRIAGAEGIGKHKTSMLQDIEAGRGPEIDALVGSVIELGRLTGVPTPHIDTVYALVKLLEQSLSAARGRLSITPLD